MTRDERPIGEVCMSTAKFDPEAIRALAQILRDTDLTEIELVEKDSRLRVVRTPPAVMAAPPMGWAAAPAAAAAPVPVAPAAAQAEAMPDAAKHPGLVTSPMVGVAYLSPEPGQPPFVTVGAKVAQGQ